MLQSEVFADRQRAWRPATLSDYWDWEQKSKDLEEENTELNKYLKHARDDKKIRVKEIEVLEADIKRLNKAFDWSAQKNAALREALNLIRSCMGDGGDLEHAADLLRVATNDHGVNQTYNNNPYAMSEQLEAMATFLHSEETPNENPPKRSHSHSLSARA